MPQSEIDQGENAAAQFLIRWRGEADPKHVEAVDTYWVTAAEHGLNSSTFTARIVASTGADCAAAMSAAVGALSGPLHGGAPTRVLKMLDEVEARGDAEAYVHDMIDRGERIMGFGHRVYRAEDPRARVLRRTARKLGSKRVEVAEALEEAALAALREKSPDRVLETNVEFWAAVVLELAEIPPDMYPPMFGCARVAGWSAHIIEQRRTGRLIRPSARYVGPPLAPRRRDGLSTLEEADAEANALRRAGVGARPRRPALASGARTSTSPPAPPTTASAPSPIAPSASSASARRSSCCAAASRTRARPAAARRCSRSSCSRATIRAT